METNYFDTLYHPLQKKNFRSALMRFLLDEFPSMGGPMILNLFLDKLENMIAEFYPSPKTLSMGQMLWFAVAKDERPAYRKPMEKTRIVPVVLPVITHEDIAKLRRQVPLAKVKQDIIARLYQEADKQGGTLTGLDVATVLLICPKTISKYTRIYEQEHDTILPRRGTVHDMGRSISHKGIICKKRKIERKSTSMVAQETNHRPESVDRYTLDLDRVTFCLAKNLSIEDTSFVTGLSKNLIIEYKNLNEEIENETINDSPAADPFDDIPF